MFLPFFVKFSELLVCLVSCTIDTESALGVCMCTTKTVTVNLFLPHLCYARLVMNVVLNTVQCTCCRVEVLSDSVHGDNCQSSGKLQLCAHGFCSVY